MKKNGNLFARGRYFDTETGKKRDVWRKVLDKKSDAKDAVITEIEKRINKELLPAEKTFADLAEYYEDKHAVPARFVNDVKVQGKKSYKSILADIKILKIFFAELPLKQITRDRIQDFKIKELDRPVKRRDRETQESYLAPRSIAAVNHQLRTLRAMLNVALSNDWIDRLPNFAGMIQSAAENKREIIPCDAEMEKILRATQKRSRLNHIKPIVIFLADTGARPIEMFNLLWNDVDFETGLVRLMSDKGKKRQYRFVPISERLLSELSELPRTNEYVFGGIKSIQSAWKSIQKEAGVYHITPYHLRRLFASRLNKMPISDITKMKLLGHTSLSMSERYTSLTPEIFEEVSKYLNSDVQNIEKLQ